ncbi:MAG TPA: ABC transporter permease [Candidatus Binataceae bacterium]
MGLFSAAAWRTPPDRPRPRRLAQSAVGAFMAAAGRTIAAITIAFGLTAIVLLALGASPFGVFRALCDGAFGNWYAVSDTIVRATPLIFTGLAVAIAFQGAIYNIGADGQLLIGALAAAAIGPHLKALPTPLALISILALGTTAGALWGATAGWLKAARNVNEVISTIMLNFIAVQTISWAIHGPIMEASRAYPRTDPIAPAAQLPLPIPPTQLNPAILIAILLAVASYALVYRSSAGFQLRAMGQNRRASAFFGIPIARLTVGAMALSGGLAGLGGAVQISAITHRLYERLSPGWGFEAIAVALLARLNPLGVIFTALLFGALDTGSQAIQRAQGVSPVMVQVIEAMVIFVLLALDRYAAADGADAVPDYVMQAAVAEAAPSDV